jgi:hypothetical protein
LPQFLVGSDDLMTGRKWLRVVLTGGVVLLAASFGFSRALRTNAARRYLVARLAASFGRPVEVSWFDFSLLNGARIEAHLVSVADDPRFGNEYFLRSDTLAAGLRWPALLAGRFEFGAVSLYRPSLNLARDAEGNWNLERWLPPVSPANLRPGFVGPVAPVREAGATPPARLDVDGGRINFKQGDNKIPFALVDVSGRVERNSAGRWLVDLEARPMRAGVELQDIGTVRLRGSIAGTTARLQPAELDLTWRSASVADALRLLRQNDYGMRGRLAVDVNARIAPDEAPATGAMNSGAAQWSISGVARFTGMHGWRLPERETDAAANVSAEMDWRLGAPRVSVRKLVVEMPASRIQGNGELEWGRGLRPELRIASSTLALGDVLTWYRALRPDVADDLRVNYVLGLDLQLGGWPLQLEQGRVSGAGGTLATRPPLAPLKIGAMNATVSRGGIDFAPTAVSFASAPANGKSGAPPAADSSENSFIVRGSVLPQASGAFRWPPDWTLSIEGATSRVQDWLALSRALAQPVNTDWSATGGLAAKIRGARRAESPVASWLGTMDFLDLTLTSAFINQPVQLPRAHVELTPSQRTISLSAAEAFGAVWRGSLARKYLDPQWTFDLTADHLDAAELDRWLGPRARPGFLARITGANPVAAAAAPANAVITRLAARGRLRAGRVDVLPMHIDKFDGDAELEGRTIRIRKAQAEFFGGKISGSLDARLLPDPSYEFQGRFDRVDLVQLGRAVSFLDGHIVGNASATLTLSAHGVGRGDLVNSIHGEGTLTGRSIEVSGLDIPDAYPGPDADHPREAFTLVRGSYRVQNKAIDLSSFLLENSVGRLEAEGRIDFSHALNLRVHPSIFQAATAPASVSPPNFLLSGTIEEPKPVFPASLYKPPARTNPR